MPEKYQYALQTKPPIKSSSRRLGFHFNSLAGAVKVHSLLSVHKQTSVCGIRRTMLLKDLAHGMDWESVEHKYGAQMVKTACADLVRQFAPKIILDNFGERTKVTPRKT